MPSLQTHDVNRQHKNMFLPRSRWALNHIHHEIDFLEANHCTATLPEHETRNPGGLDAPHTNKHKHQRANSKSEKGEMPREMLRESIDSSVRKRNLRKAIFVN